MLSQEDAVSAPEASGIDGNIFVSVEMSRSKWVIGVHTPMADKTLAGVANFLSDPKRPIETTLRAMMTTPHLGTKGVHPVVASAARELLNKRSYGEEGAPPATVRLLELS